MSAQILREMTLIRKKVWVNKTAISSTCPAKSHQKTEKTETIDGISIDAKPIQNQQIMFLSRSLACTAQRREWNGNMNRMRLDNSSGWEGKNSVS